MARPRSARAHDAVIDAAIALIAERGIDATSMDAIAAASGVSKATIYKHWPDKDALCLEAMAHLHGRDLPLPAIDTGNVRADLIAVLTHQPPDRHAALRLRAMPHLMAYAARNPAFGQAWRARVFDPPRLQVAGVLARAIEAGRLRDDVDMEVALALLLGPVTYAHIRKLSTGHLPAALPEAVVDGFLRIFGMGDRPAPPKRRDDRSAGPRRATVRPPA